MSEGGSCSQGYSKKASQKQLNNTKRHKQNSQTNLRRKSKGRSRELNEGQRKQQKLLIIRQTAKERPIIRSNKSSKRSWISEIKELEKNNINKTEWTPQHWRCNWVIKANDLRSLETYSIVKRIGGKLNFKGDGDMKAKDYSGIHRKCNYTSLLYHFYVIAMGGHVMTTSTAIYRLVLCYVCLPKLFCLV